MNDVLATLLALGLLYLVVKFAFGGPSSASPSTNHPQPIPAHEQQAGLATRHRGTAASTSSPWATASSNSKKETLISRYGLEGRLSSEGGRTSSPSDSATSGSAGPGTLGGKGKGKVQNDEDWKKGAEGRREELKRRKEEMILDARRKLLEKQHFRASTMEGSSSAPSVP